MAEKKESGKSHLLGVGANVGGVDVSGKTGDLSYRDKIDGIKGQEPNEHQDDAQGPQKGVPGGYDGRMDSRTTKDQSPRKGGKTSTGPMPRSVGKVVPPRQPMAPVNPMAGGMPGGMPAPAPNPLAAIINRMAPKPPFPGRV
jgi:hypothetical protein